MATILERPKAVTPIKATKKPEAGTVHWLNECIEHGKRAPFSEVKLLTPGLAEELLRRNPDNRPLVETQVAKIAADIRSGRWGLNMQPIVMSACGLMNDGQHRCHAVINANRPAPVSFAFGAERETRLTLDQNTKRTAGHLLAMQHVPNAAQAAGIARIIIAYERSGGDNISGTGYITNPEIVARVASDPAIGVSAAYASHVAKSTQPYCAPSAIGACRYILTGEHPADAAAYMDQVCIGESIRKSDPAFTVRERLLVSSKSTTQKLEIIFRGWNAYRADRPLKLIKVLGNLPALV